MQGFATFNTQSGTGFSSTVAAATATGRGVRVFDIHVIPTVTFTNLQLRTNSTTGPIYLIVDCDSSSKSWTESFSEGTLFPNGCYLVTSANFAAATINYTTEII